MGRNATQHVASYSKAALCSALMAVPDTILPSVSSAGFLVQGVYEKLLVHKVHAGHPEIIPGHNHSTTMT